jgi:hypothetical protein
VDQCIPYRRATLPHITFCKLFDKTTGTKVRKKYVALMFGTSVPSFKEKSFCSKHFKDVVETFVSIQ